MRFQVGEQGRNIQRTDGGKGLWQVRKDPDSMAGHHAPWVSHAHLQRFAPGVTKDYELNLHIKLDEVSGGR